jgi:hypothetical protein
MATDQTLEQLNQYYELNLDHLKWSFWCSLGALGAGLCALLVGVALLFAGREGVGPYLTVIAGVLTEFVGAGFFALYNKNLKQLNVFYDKLIKHKDTVFAISLSNQFPEPEKLRLYSAIVGSLLSRGEPATSPEVLKAIVERQRDGSNG